MVPSADTSKTSGQGPAKIKLGHLRIGLRTPNSAGWAATEPDHGSYSMLFLRTNGRSGNSSYRGPRTLHMRHLCRCLRRHARDQGPWLERAPNRLSSEASKPADRGGAVVGRPGFHVSIR